MNAWILVLIVYTSGGVSVSQQEYASQATCNAAATTIEARIATFRIGQSLATCVKK
jgi:hypothetical protein